jgi:hypothetical protein
MNDLLARQIDALLDRPAEHGPDPGPMLPPSVTAIFLAVTIIGIPFAWAHLKLAGIALRPVGKMIVLAEDAPLQYPRRR